MITIFLFIVVAVVVLVSLCALLVWWIEHFTIPYLKSLMADDDDAPPAED